MIGSFCVEEDSNNVQNTPFHETRKEPGLKKKTNNHVRDNRQLQCQGLSHKQSLALLNLLPLFRPAILYRLYGLLGCRVFKAFPHHQHHVHPKKP